ncbi:MAG TPA: PLP-dependent transferase [Candidatus Baltobacteraceae bacterium]|jgi:methionine-gamma-lyase|nr:PLP-dependent transferase [Candidatus Baltobacteraceae bacterium]
MSPTQPTDRERRESQPLRPTTKVLTQGFDPSLSVGSARPAVFRSSTYVFPSPEAAERAFDLASGRAKMAEGETTDLIYARFNHPNAEILEDQIVNLEAGARAALAFNSGMAAIMTSLFTFLRPGQSIVYTVPIYGGTQHFIQDHLSKWGITGIPVVAGRGDLLESAICSAQDLGLVMVETPANPTLIMTDLQQVCDAVAALKIPAGATRPLVMVDNTLLGPAFQHPLSLGADLVVYSGTKYLSGFSDMLAGIVLAADPDLVARLGPARGLFGTILQPDECWMLGGRLPTVGLRMNRASKNAQRIAEHLYGHPKIKRTVYPTLLTDPEQKRIFEAQCDYPGAMFSIELTGGKPAAFEFLRHVQIARNAVSLGGVESLACHPKTTTHSGFTDEEFAQAGITDGLVRVSVGIEHWRDLLADFEQALDHV